MEASRDRRSEGKLVADHGALWRLHPTPPLQFTKSTARPLGALGRKPGTQDWCSRDCVKSWEVPYLLETVNILFLLPHGPLPHVETSTPFLTGWVKMTNYMTIGALRAASYRSSRRCRYIGTDAYMHTGRGRRTRFMPTIVLLSRGRRMKGPRAIPVFGVG